MEKTWRSRLGGRVKFQEFSFREVKVDVPTVRSNQVRRETGCARLEFWREAGDINLGVISVEKVFKPCAG